MLTDTRLRTLKPQAKTYKETDSHGLYVEVRPSGARYFRYRYRHPQTKKEQVLGLGEYPALGLKQARDLRDEAKALLVQGVDPVEYRKEQKQRDEVERQNRARADHNRRNKVTFKKAYDAFCKFKTTGYGGNAPAWSYQTLKKHNERFGNYVFPMLGERLLEELTEADLEECLLAIQERGTLVNRNKVKTVFNGLFGWAYGQRYPRTQQRWIARNIAKYISEEIFHKHTPTQYKHLTETKELKCLLSQIRDLSATLEVKTAVSMAVHVFLRPSNLVGMRWEQVDFEEGVIRFSGEEMKMSRAYLLPMSRQVERMLMEIKALTGHSDYVFLSPYGSGDKSISRDSLSNAMRRNGIDNVNPHGLRHTASTALNNLGFDGDVIELSLAHVTGGVRGVYNKADRLAQRKELMQAWSNYLDGLLVDGDVIPLHKKRV